MNKNEIVKVEAQQIAETQETLKDLTKLAQNAISAYNSSHPIFIKISNKLLEAFADDNTINTMEHSDMLRLLDIANKNQLVPIQELTKLTKELNILHERLIASDDVSQLKQVVAELKARVGDNSIEAEITEPKPEPELESDIVEEVAEEDLELDPRPPLEEALQKSLDEVGIDAKVSITNIKEAFEPKPKHEPQPDTPNKVLTIAELLKTKGKV